VERAHCPEFTVTDSIKSDNNKMSEAENKDMKPTGGTPADGGDRGKQTAAESPAVPDGKGRSDRRPRTAILKTAVNACRLIVALTFIFSGYVKAIDPLGTQYKIDDYLEALSLAEYVPHAATLAASVLLSAIEFCTGMFMLFAIHRRVVSRIALAFMAVMTATTLWLALANPIEDCGCFGDAVKLTNWQTFGKNIILLAATAVIWRSPLSMVRFISKTNQWIVLNYTVLFILASSAWCLYDLPIFDFRPYHTGADIKKGMEIPEGAEQPQFETTFILEKNGERREFTLDNYPDSTWTFIDSRTVQTAKGYEPPIHDFSIQTADGEDITDQVLSDTTYTFLLISPHLEYADDSNFGEIDRLYEYARDNGCRFYGLTASGDKAIQRWRELTGAEYEFFATDETTLKTIIRSNPGLLLMRQGVIISKWSHNRLPQVSGLTVRPGRGEAGGMHGEPATHKIMAIILWFVLPLLVLTVTDRIWAWTRRIRRKKNNSRI